MHIGDVEKKLHEIFNNWWKVNVEDTDGFYYEPIQGFSGRWWVYQPKHPCIPDTLNIEAKPQELIPGYKGFQGYAGSELRFQCGPGAYIYMKAPWHSNADAFFHDTSIDYRDKHVTIGAVVSYKIDLNDVQVIFEDTAPVTGTYERIHIEARKIQKKLHEDKDWTTKLRVIMLSRGGGCVGPVRPLAKENTGSTLMEVSSGQQDIITR